jgi:small subunit ribosomal protein S20
MAQAKKDGKKERRPQAQKRAIQAEARAMRNRIFKSRVRTALRQLRESVQAGAKELIQERLAAVYSLADKGAKRGVFKANKAARMKSRITQELARATV